MNIIGKSECTASQMAQYLINKNPNAKSWALEYAKLYLEEGEAEGVRGDGAWIQSCKETGNFTFTGGTAVTFDQNNFCGLGVTKKGMKGNSFDTPRLGIRAQIQHLKAYATTAALKNSCIDPRYKYVTKGCAPTFELLAGKWAVPGYDTSKASSLEDAMKKGIGYGFDIVAGIKLMKTLPTNAISTKDEVNENNKGGNKMKISISAGHNPRSKVAHGAVGLICESTEARNVTAKVIQMLKAQGHEVYDDTVNDGTSQNDVLKKIVNKVNAHKNLDVAISIHFNAGANKILDRKTTGTEVFVYNAASKAKDMAQKIVNSIASLGFKNRGVKTSTSLYFLRKTNAPSILVEAAFVDDPDDVALYNADKMAQAIVKGITGVAHTITTNNTPSTPNQTTPSTTKKEFKVRVKASSLNIRAGAGTKYKVVGKITDKGVYTIVDTYGNWGKLKSGKGWINISSLYAERV